MTFWPLSLWYLVGRKSIWTLRNYDSNHNENNKKVIGLMRKTTTLQMHHAFSNFLCNDLKWPNFKFTWELEWIGKAINYTIYVWNWVWSPPFSSKQNSHLLSNMVKRDNRQNGRWRCQIVRSITLPVTHTTGTCFQDARCFLKDPRAHKIIWQYIDIPPTVNRYSTDN